MQQTDKIYVAGHNGMVGSAIVRALAAQGYTNVITKSSHQLDLKNQAATNEFFAKEKPDYVFIAAAKVGGILANNTYRAEFLYNNLIIEANLIHASHVHNAKKLLFLGSSCIYPKLAPQPLKEEYLLTGPLEQTNEPYAIAKIAGIKLCESYRDQYGCNFISAMPTNLFGQRDNYHPQNSHVVAALIRKFHEAKVNNDPHTVIWGTGSPMREFMFVDDLADACIFLMKEYNDKLFINVGTGEEMSIKDLALMIRDIVGYTGDVQFDTSKPDGTPRKIMDNSRIHALGWRHKTSMRHGLEIAYESFRKETATSNQN
jgi:GDP-L-fucose synthase